MTTSHSPLRVLKAQATQIAAALKAAERGELNSPNNKIAEALKTDSITVGVVMDDKTFMLTIPWVTIRETPEAGMIELIMKYMRGVRDN